MNLNPDDRNEGFALIVTSVMLLLVAVLALVSIDHTGSEAASSARARNTARTLQAADGGMQLALSRLTKASPNLNPINFSLGDIVVQSRTRSQGSPQSIVFAGAGAAPDGYAINVGSGVSTNVYMVNITAADPGGSTSQIESKFFSFSAAGSEYQ